MRRGACSSALALVLLLGCAVGANASRASSRVSADRFCTVSRGVATDIVNLTNVMGASSPAKLKAEFADITAAAPALKSSAPAKLKTDVNQVLGFATVLKGDLAAVGWSIIGLAPKLPTLAAQGAKVKPAILALRAYYEGPCKFDV
jgi:hypothetical protein